MRKLFVEGGGNNNDALAKECREGFAKLLQKANLKGRLPRVIPCGGRTAALRDFRNALASAGEESRLFLLVDAEDPVKTDSAWQHVSERQGDRWEKPPGAKEEQLHLMTQCMESWFLADRPALKRVFASHFEEGVLPRDGMPIEQVAKNEALRALDRALHKPGSPKKGYNKGDHSFKVLAQLDPARIRSASGWAERFFATLERLL